LLGNLPHLYVYAANNPSESILAKRRGYGVLVSHNVPPYGRAGLYKELITLRELIAEFREDPQANRVLQDAILTKITDTGLAADCPLPELKAQGLDFTPENARLFSNAVLDRYFVTLYEYLQVLENRLFSSGLHVLGQPPNVEAVSSYLEAYFGERLAPDLIEQIAANTLPEQPNIETLTKRYLASEPLTPLLLEEAITIRQGLTQTTDELANLLFGLNGEYIPPAPGGDLLRDGPGALPTGRNIHALDPYRMPSPAAYERGRAIGRKLIANKILFYGFIRLSRPQKQIIQQLNDIHKAVTKDT
ncbi:MAG: cobaltochelatase subunit CobN, partial [Cyanobacteria bacterium J06636_28]